VSPTKASASRAGSPAAGPIDHAAILQVIQRYPEGVSIGNLLRDFGTRVGDGPGQMPRKEWIGLVKEACVFGADKLLRPRPKANA